MRGSLLRGRGPWGVLALVLILLGAAIGAMAAATAAAEPARPEVSPLLPGAADSPEWWSAVSRSIAATEYAVTRQAGAAAVDGADGWQAPNRANGFRSLFATSGVTVVPRGGDESGWEWGIALVGVGRAGADVVAAAPAQLEVDGNRVEYRRGAIVEWYVNDPKGLEQGFTIAARPAAGERGPLVLALALRGDTVPSFAADGSAVDFVRSGVRVLRYGALRVTDATGREIPARLEGRAERARRTPGRGWRSWWRTARRSTR